MEQIGGNSLVIKEININLVRKALKDKGHATKQQLAETTGLSLVTVGTVLLQLLKEEKALEAGMSLSRGGRPAQEFKYNEDYALGLILYTQEKEGQITVRSTVVNLYGKTVYDAVQEVKQVDLPTFEQIIDRLLADYPAVQAIGFGLPVAEFDGKVIVSDYKALVGVSVTGHFSTRYSLPVVMENDVNAAVVGYCKSKEVPNNRTVVYIYFPELYPPGSGIMIQGKLYKGNGNFAGEVACLPLGINWTEPALYASISNLSEALAKVTVAVSCVLNPDLVVLYGDSLTPGHLTSALEQCAALLPQSVIPDLLLSEDFAADYIGGMIERTLDTLEPDITLSRH